MPSDWKQSGIDKRDFRHTHNGPEIPKHRKKGGKSKVCKKNKETGEHVFGPDKRKSYSGITFGGTKYEWLACKFCGKSDLIVTRKKS